MKITALAVLITAVAGSTLAFAQVDAASPVPGSNTSAPSAPRVAPQAPRAPAAPMAPRAPNAPDYYNRNPNQGTDPQPSNSTPAQTPTLEQQRQQSGQSMEDERKSR